LWRQVSITITLLVVIAAAILMVQFGTSPENAARVRNSLTAEVGALEDFSWTPAHIPGGFEVERSDPPEPLADVVEQLLPTSDISDTESRAGFDTAIVLARHLSANQQSGEPIQSNTLATYRQIVDAGEGYCADYSQVFTALALAVDVPVREWGLGWEGFGLGHAFNEVFDESMQAWAFIDSFHSLYVVDADTGIPLSVLQFQNRLRIRPEATNMRVVPLFPDRPYFKTQEEALEYYARGADQFFMFWGNNVFSFDSNVFMKLLEGFPRSIEVMAAIVLGIQPSIRLVETETNAAHVAELFRTRRVFLAYFVLCCLGFVALLAQVWLLVRARR